LLHIITAATVCIALASLAQAVAGWWAVRRYSQTERNPEGPYPAITVLKPLHGDEPMLEEALASFCMQDYGTFQVVFGLQDPADPALHVIRRLRTRFPDVDMDVVIDPAQHGVNRKIGNLINMYARAKHDVIVMADSDIHAAPDYLTQLAIALAQPNTGLVTTLYAGVGASDTFAGRLGMSQINHCFLPGALMARMLGRQDCLGATMALTRQMLESIGGLQALAHHLADDAILGQLVTAKGLSVTLASTLPATTVPEMRINHLFAHELRWARTIQSLAPVGFVLSSLQYPLFWASAVAVMTGGQTWSLALLVITWLIRALVVLGIDSALGLAMAVPIWLLPIRDLLSVAVILASYGGNEVAWRGHVLRISPPSLAPGKG
jgi:ceramide glucosyltransferase